MPNYAQIFSKHKSLSLKDLIKLMSYLSIFFKKIVTFFFTLSSTLWLNAIMNITDFKNTISPIKNKLFRFALRIVNDPAEAEDVVQEVFIKLWKYLEKGEQIDNAEAWCMRAVRNQAIDKLRSKHKRVEALDSKYDQKDKSASPFQLAAMKDTFKHIKNMIDQLPEKQKLVMHLRDIEGHTYQEIADALSLPLGQVKVNLFRARQTIRAKLLKSKIIDMC